LSGLVQLPLSDRAGEKNHSSKAGSISSGAVKENAMAACVQANTFGDLPGWFMTAGST
jgi:hypothetical protein